MTALWRFLGHASTIANSVILQTALYVSYVAIFQLLTETLRLKEEYHFDKLIADTFIDNYFDSAHNTFQSMRRPADFYEWGNNVLIPGLFSNAGPCAREVGAAGHFSSATSRSAPTDVAGAMLAKGCNDDAWPDGGGSFHLASATAWSVGEVLENLDVLDWSDGLIIKQARVSPLSAQHCATKLFTQHCLREIEIPHDNRPSSPSSPSSPSVTESGAGYVATADASAANRATHSSDFDATLTQAALAREPFGYNWTHPGSPLAHPWKYFTHGELGGNPAGQISAAIPS